jgi:hypothetical protein
MPRTDENGRQLRALLDYLLDGQLTTKQMHQALGISSSSYHRRVRDDDYPNADELHKIATRFHLSFTDLQVRLGFVTREDLVCYVRSRHIAPTASKIVGPDQSTHVAS